MIYLLLSIVCSSVLFLTFRAFGKYNVPTFPAIVINYLVASLFGFLLAQPNNTQIQVWNYDWFWAAFLIGSAFIGLFWLIAISAQKIGTAISAVSNKMSVVIPVVAAFILYDEQITVIKIVAILITLLGVYLAFSIKHKLDPSLVYLPIIIFISNGFLDTFIKYTQATYIGESDEFLFVPSLFSVAMVIGFITLIFQKKHRAAVNKTSVIGGIILGVFNYGSIYFLIKTLGLENMESSVIFPINNIGIVIVTSLLSVLIFHEKLSGKNWTGIVLSCIGLSILGYCASKL